MSFPIIHSTGSVPDQGSMIFPQVAAAARDAGQPTETLASPPAIDHTTNLSIGRNANVTGTNARTTTEASDIVMVDIGALTIQHNVQANNVDAPGNIVSTPIRNARVSFVEDLEEELPPAYEEHAPANSRRLPYVLDTPPPARRTRWIGRDSYRPRAPFQNHTREATYIDRRPRSSSSRIRRPSNRSSSVARNRTQAPNRRPFPPASARSNMSSSSSSPSPPSSPLPTIPATPRMRPARPPIMDGRTSAALTVTMFFRCLRSIRLTLRTFPANHPYAAQHQQLQNETDLMELWFHNHHEHL
ncbi:hypothetical protein Pst134EA_004612 [Puccinia striiformis f. sp. tritici]|uniref:hypothetical protein n=1 Tax=Puccinia striiformis f. sp. tritici TaxID=168172 RepID=UPI0020077BB2|nr:hypothetical protein Pst134EA_004612 [Puccinia striiformis f. sp. tritici]KAH9470688.1 hypothetical protein Pst134EA_004612 [Puccinia striiformis f. sp. tritici]